LTDSPPDSPSQALVPVVDEATALVPTGVPPPTEEQIKRLRKWADKGVPKNTQEAYTRDWEDFERWCKQYGHPSLPAAPQTLVLYASDLGEEKKLSTIRRRLAAISRYHRNAGRSTPCSHPYVKEQISRLRVAKQDNPTRKQAIDLELLRKMLAVWSSTSPKGARNRALLLVGWTGAFRRSEYVSLDRKQVEIQKGRVNVHLGRTKTDQTGIGCVISLPENPYEKELCPVEAIKNWLSLSPKSEYLFPGSGDGHLQVAQVNRIVKESAKRAGLDPKPFGSHSLRAGFVTQALRDGKEALVVMKQTRHRNVQTLKGYQREVDPLQGNAVADIWNRKGKDK